MNNDDHPLVKLVAQRNKQRSEKAHPKFVEKTSKEIAEMTVEVMENAMQLHNNKGLKLIKENTMSNENELSESQPKGLYHVDADKLESFMTRNMGEFNKMKSLEKDIASVLNKHGIDNLCGTPDFILGEMLVNHLETFAFALLMRQDHKIN